MHKNDEYSGKICNNIPCLVCGRCFAADKVDRSEHNVDSFPTLRYNNQERIYDFHERMCSLEDNH